MKYYCPICGYDSLTRPPADYNICPCCGTEFGYDDIAHTWDELRIQWLSKGSTWFSTHTPPPPNWDATAQVGRLIGQNLRNVAGTNSPEPPEVSRFLPTGIFVEQDDVILREKATTESSKPVAIAT